MSRSRAIYTYRVCTLMEETYSSLYETKKKNNRMNETERSCQFLKSVLGTMQAAWQVACFPFQPETQEEKQVWRLLGCLSPKICSTSWKRIKILHKLRGYKNKEIVWFPAKAFSELTTKRHIYKQSLVTKVNLLLVHFYNFFLIHCNNL